jgi:hypothetical protein
MRRLVFVSIVALVLATSVYAQGNLPLITLDENGNGSLLFPGGPAIPTAGVLAQDPGPGGLLAAMTYNLLGPPSLVAGDLFILEPSAGVSDLIRFNPAVTGGNPNYPASVVFYSDTDADGASLADTGLPTAFYANTFVLPELSLGGAGFGAIYTPTAGQPGFIPGFSVTYDLISDAPEPASIGLVLLGAGALVVARRFKRRVA